MGEQSASTTSCGEKQSSTLCPSEKRHDTLLKRRVARAERFDRRVDEHLGIQPMPLGYALMVTPDGFFYWLCWDGLESASHWSKWAVWRGARDRAQASRP